MKTAKVSLVNLHPAWFRDGFVLTGPFLKNTRAMIKTRIVLRVKSPSDGRMAEEEYQEGLNNSEL